MEVGTIETNVEEKKLKRRARVGGGFGSNGGNRNRGGGGNNGGGGNDRRDDDFTEELQKPYESNKFRIAMWFLLLVVTMTFGGLIGAYIVISTNGVLEWRPFDLPKQIWVSTVLIAASSLTYQISQTFLKKDNQARAKNWLLATTVFGAMFIASQILAWLALVREGVYMQSNPYAGFFYIMTAVHAAHVIGGICALGYILLRTWHKTGSIEEMKKRKQISNTVGWYWHFMDALWVVLFLLLGFWK